MCSNADFATTQKRLPGANIQTEHCTYVMMKNCKSVLSQEDFIRKLTLSLDLLDVFRFQILKRSFFSCMGFPAWCCVHHAVPVHVGVYKNRRAPSAKRPFWAFANEPAVKAPGTD